MGKKRRLTRAQLKTLGCFNHFGFLEPGNWLILYRGYKPGRMHAGEPFGWQAYLRGAPVGFQREQVLDPMVDEVSGREAAFAWLRKKSGVAADAEVVPCPFGGYILKTVFDERMAHLVGVHDKRMAQRGG